MRSFLDLRPGAAALSMAGLLGLASASACQNQPLQKVPPPVVSLDNELQIQGEFCTAPPVDAKFPVKIMFLVDVSGSMVVTDPAKVRVQAINEIINKYQGLPNIYFDVITFSSSIQDVTRKMPLTGFTANPDLTNIDMAASQEDDLTDDQGALAQAYETLVTDMMTSSAADRARSKYIIIFFTDGVPDPVCNADMEPCGPTLICDPGSHCVPTTQAGAGGKESESYSCDPDYMICSVPKMDWSSAFNPPVPASLYPQLQNGANYNTLSQLLVAVQRIMSLQSDFHVGSITLNTNFLFPVNALSNPLAMPFQLDRPAAEGLLTAMAMEGNGVFQEFTDDTQINFLNIDFSTLQVPNSIVQTLATNTNALEQGSYLAVDSDGDGLSDEEEKKLGTCVTIGPGKCATPWDSDGDGYSDFLEVKYKTSGFDPLDPTKPANACGTVGLDHDADGLYDCEEAFLGTDPTNIDTDGDFMSDLLEVRNGLNPLDPTDATGDFNHDGILNEQELKDGLSAVNLMSSGELGFAYTYNLEALPPTNSGATGSCYNFQVGHMRLLTTGQTQTSPVGANRIYYDLVQTQDDSPTTSSSYRRACADVLYDNGVVKLPLTGVVNFVDSDFVDLASFDPSINCKNLAEGAILDGGILNDGGTLTPIATTTSVDGGARDGGAD